MSRWWWTKFWWGMLLLPVLVIIFTLMEGESVDFSPPLVAFVSVWMVGVLFAMRRLGIPPFGKDDAR